MELTVGPDVEDLIRLFLIARLPDVYKSVPVHIKVPNPRPGEFVLVPRNGGTSPNRVSDGATIRFECWADRDSVALSLAQKVRALVNALPQGLLGSHQVYRVQEYAGPALLPDGLSDQARYVFTANIQLRATHIKI